MTEELFNQIVEIAETVAGFTIARRAHPNDRSRQDSFTRDYEETMQTLRRTFVEVDPFDGL